MIDKMIWSPCALSISTHIRVRLLRSWADILETY